MDSFEFRTIAINGIREFEKWAWRDSRDNPDEYSDMTFDRWFQMFKEYVGDNS